MHRARAHKNTPKYWCMENGNWHLPSKRWLRIVTTDNKTYGPLQAIFEIYFQSGKQFIWLRIYQLVNWLLCTMLIWNAHWQNNQNNNHDVDVVEWCFLHFFLFCLISCFVFHLFDGIQMNFNSFWTATYHICWTSKLTIWKKKKT